MKRVLLVATVLLVASVARDAAAQGFISPFVGTTLTSPSANGTRSKPGYGIALGKLGKIVGAETEIAYFPEVLDNTAEDLAKSRAITFSADTLIGPTIGRVKPYAAVGVGDMYLNVTSLPNSLIPDPANIATNYFTVNAGGGVMGFFTTHLGMRADLRYFRAYGFKLTDLESAGITLDHFNFWRASVGLTAKF